MQYLKEYKPFVYINLLTSGRLNEYLASVDEQAEDMFSRLVKEYAADIMLKVVACARVLRYNTGV